MQQNESKIKAKKSSPITKIKIVVRLLAVIFFLGFLIFAITGLLVSKERMAEKAVQFPNHDKQKIQKLFFQDPPLIFDEEVQSVQLTREGLEVITNANNYLLLISTNLTEHWLSYEIKRSTSGIKGKWVFLFQPNQPETSVIIQEKSYISNAGYRSLLFYQGENCLIDELVRQINSKL